MKPVLTVIIPTLNNTFGLKHLLSYLKDQPYQVIVVDNQPTNKKLESLKAGKFESLVYFPQKKNLGFAGGVNSGVKNIESRWFLILNDDIKFDRVHKNNTVKKLIKYAETKKLDAVTPVLRNPEGKVENMGYGILPNGRIELVKTIPRLGDVRRFFARTDKKGSQSNKKQRFRANQSDVVLENEATPESIDGITAACLLIKTNVFKKLKGFDERFFAYLEDVDFFLRFKKAGYKMGIAKDIGVFHNHMTTSKTMGNFKARQDMVNWWRLYFKHPDIFKFNFDFIIERLRNILGYLKATLSQ